MTEPFECAPITHAFRDQSLHPASFHHADHVRVAFDLLRHHDFIDAAAAYAKGIRTIAANAGVPQKFNLTITYAFISLIAERLAANPVDTFDTFVLANPDLMNKDVLTRWYREDRLNSDMARTLFLLPDAA